jgi:Ca2+-binding EF-hand superfamily protein
LVAKLKALFDRFDEERTGKLTASQIERLLHYMNRPTNLNKVVISDGI